MTNEEWAQRVDIFDEIDAMSNDEAEDLLVWRRWGKRGPTCPKCGSHVHYRIWTRKRFKCSGCLTQYTATSGTVLGYRKLGAKFVLKAACLADEEDLSPERVMKVLGVTRGAVPSVTLMIMKIREADKDLFADLG